MNLIARPELSLVRNSEKPGVNLLLLLIKTIELSWFGNLITSSQDSLEKSTRQETGRLEGLCSAVTTMTITLEWIKQFGGWIDHHKWVVAVFLSSQWLEEQKDIPDMSSASKLYGPFRSSGRGYTHMVKPKQEEASLIYCAGQYFNNSKEHYSPFNWTLNMQTPWITQLTFALLVIAHASLFSAVVLTKLRMLDFLQR